MTARGPGGTNPAVHPRESAAGAMAVSSHCKRTNLAAQATTPQQGLSLLQSSRAPRHLLHEAAHPFECVCPFLVPHGHTLVRIGSSPLSQDLLRVGPADAPNSMISRRSKQTICSFRRASTPSLS